MYAYLTVPVVFLIATAVPAPFNVSRQRWPVQYTLLSIPYPLEQRLSCCRFRFRPSRKCPTPCVHAMYGYFCAVSSTDIVKNPSQGRHYLVSPRALSLSDQYMRPVHPHRDLLWESREQHMAGKEGMWRARAHSCMASRLFSIGLYS